MFGVFRQLSRMVYRRDIKYVLLMHVGAFDAKMLPELLALYRSKGVSFISLPVADPYMMRRNTNSAFSLGVPKMTSRIKSRISRCLCVNRSAIGLAS